MVLRRALAHRIVLAAAFATIVMATTVLASTNLYVRSVTESGLRGALTGAPLGDRVVEVELDLDDGAELAPRDHEVRAALAAAFEVVGVAVHGSAVSTSYALPTARGADVEDLTVFAFFEELSDHATLVDGQWPEPADGPVLPVALHRAAAEAFGLAPGDRLTVVNRLSDTLVQVSVAGTYDVTDPASAYWNGDPLGSRGIEVGGSFTTYGPLILPQQTFLDRFGDEATAVWRADPRLAELEIGDLAELERSVSLLGDAEEPGTLGDDVQVQTGVEELLDGVETPLLVGRSAVAMPSALLVVLAGYALLLTTRLLGEHRTLETALLRSRGVSSGQLVTRGLREALLMTVPAALVSPWLAALLLRAYDRFGPLSDAGVPLAAQPDASTWAVSSLVAAGATIVLVAPSWQRATTFVESSQSRGRQSRRSGLQRAGGDLILVLVAGLAYWQLARYGSPVLTDATGGLAVDPLLVLAPAFVLLAGAVIALRLLPLLSAGAERLAARSRGATAALGTWELSRRVKRHTGPALLLVLATAIGTFSVTYASAWTGSQQDQADFRTGADLRLTALPAAATTTDIEQLPGVAASMPVLRENVSFGELDAEVIAVDAADAADVVELRDDLADQPLSDVTGELVGSRPVLPALEAPADARSVVVPVRLSTATANDPQVSVSVVLRDGRGVLHRETFPAIPADSRERRLRIDLRGYAGPVQVVSIQVQHSGDFPPGATQPVVEPVVARLGPVAASGSGSLEAPAGSAWQVDFNRDTDFEPVVRAFHAPEGAAAIEAILDPGCCDLVQFTFSLSGKGAATGNETLPALVSSDLADALGNTDTFLLDTVGGSIKLRVAGVLQGVPTVEHEEAAGVVVDLPSLLTVAYRQSGSVAEPGEWWLAVRGDDPATTVAAIEEDHLLSRATLLDRRAAGESLRADPVGIGILGALTIGSLAAGAFAVIGFAVSIGVSARERRTEFALLRAVGAGRRQLTRLLGLEQAVLIALGLGVGLVIGVAVARLVVPVVTLTAQAIRPFPAVQVLLPWSRLALFSLAVVVLLSLVVAVLTGLLRRRAVTAQLRLGEET